MFYDKEMIYLCFFALYSIVLLIVGKSRMQQQNTLRHFYLGNRSLNLFRCTLTFIGTWISAATILGFTGNVFESGLAPLLYSVVPWFLGAFLLYFISGRLYEYDVLTIPELIRKKYGSKWLQVIFAWIMMISYTLYLIIHIKGFGLVASVLFDIPYKVATLMIYLFILYSAFGGFRAVARIHVMHVLLLTAGTALAFLLVVGRAGGLPELFRGFLGIGELLKKLSYFLFGNLPMQSVGTKQQDISVGKPHHGCINIELGGYAQSFRENMPLRMTFRFLLRELAFTIELGREGMIMG